MNPAYPTTEDLSLAIWLKRFARALPIYAAKYQITEAEARAFQTASASFLDGMEEQISRVTQAISWLAAPRGAGWPPAAVPYQPSLHGLPQQAAALSYRILSHSAYDPTDGCELGLELPLQHVSIFP